MQVSTEAAPIMQSEAQTFTIGVLPQIPGFPQLAPDCDLQVTVRETGELLLLLSLFSPGFIRNNPKQTFLHLWLMSLHSSLSNNNHTDGYNSVHDIYNILDLIFRAFKLDYLSSFGPTRLSVIFYSVQKLELQPQDRKTFAKSFD